MDRLHNADLTALDLHERIAYEPTTGEFVWKATGKTAGTTNGRGYRQIRVMGRIYLAHRLAMLSMAGEWPRQFVDHIDGDRSNNRISNLRQASPSINGQNVRGARRNSHSGLLGVERSGSGYQARITVNGKRRGLGSFPTAELAHVAYLGAKRSLHEGNTL